MTVRYFLCSEPRLFQPLEVVSPNDPRILHTVRTVAGSPGDLMFLVERRANYSTEDPMPELRIHEYFVGLLLRWDNSGWKPINYFDCTRGAKWL